MYIRASSAHGLDNSHIMGLPNYSDLSYSVGSTSSNLGRISMARYNARNIW